MPAIQGKKVKKVKKAKVLRVPAPEKGACCTLAFFTFLPCMAGVGSKLHPDLIVTLQR